MADDNVLGAVKIEIRGDWSKLASDFASAEGTARNLAASITGNLNVAFRAGTGLVDQFGRSTAAAGSAAASAAPQTDKLAQSVSRLATSINSTATTNRILTDALQQSTSAMRETAAAAALSSEGIDMLGASVTAALGKMTAANAGAQELRSTYLSIGLAVRTIRIGEMLVRGIEAIHDLYVAARDARTGIESEFHGIELALGETGDALALATVKIDNTLARLAGRPENGIAVALAESTVAADKFAKQVEGDLEKIHEGLKKTEITPTQGALRAQSPTSQLTEQFNRGGKYGVIPQAVADIDAKAIEQIRQAKDYEEQLAIARKRDADVTTLLSNAVTLLNDELGKFKAPQAFDLFFRGRFSGAEGVQATTDAIRALKAEMANIPKLEVLGPKERNAEQIETDRKNAAQAAIVPRARVDSALAQITEETRAREKASQDAIALSRETARAEIEAMRDPHQRAIADAQEELKVAKDTQAALLATQRTQVPRQTAAIQQRGNLDAAGKAPEAAQADRIGAARQVEEVNAEAALKRQEAASAVAIAEQKVTATVAQQNREIDQATQKTAAKLAATRESAALEAQALQVEREVGVAAGATGAVKITQMRAQADAQAAQRDGEVRRLHQEADAEGDQTKKAELLAQAEEKRLENANKTYAAETKILEVMAQQAKQLAEIETKRRGQVEDAGIGQQKALAQRAATLQGPGITPQATAANEIALKQQLLALDTQQHSLDVERLTTQGDIAALYGDQIAAAKDYAEADKVAADSLTKEIQQQTEILALQKQQTLQAELQGNLRSALSGAEAGVGQGVAAGVLGKKGPGESVGQEIEKSLRNVGQQLFGNVLTNVIRQLVTSLTANTAASTVLHAIFGTATAAQATATAANTAATLTGTAATSVNTLSQTVLTASNVALTTALTANTTALLVNTFVPKPFGFAGGGHPPVGVTSIVGENGPELFVPKEAGTIIPAGKFGSSGGSFGAALAGLPRFSNVTNSGSMSIGSFNMQVHGPSNPKQFAEEVMKHIAYRAKSQGGPGFSPLSRAFQGASGGTNS